MTNEKVHITIELPRDYRVWDLLDLPGRIVDITGVEHTELTARYSVPASEALSEPGEWVRHTGTECPVHPLDVVEVRFNSKVTTIDVAWTWEWCEDSAAPIEAFRHVCDSEGIPYVYDDGSLPQWAEYVATDEDGDALCYARKPWVDKTPGGVWYEHNDDVELAPDSYANTLVPWTESLRRVYREE